MRKVFFAPTVEAAVASARRELGDEALLVDVQSTASERGRPGGYQVLFELNPNGLDSVGQEGPPFEHCDVKVAGNGLEEVKDELAKLSSLVSCLASSGTPNPASPEITRMAALLQYYDLPVDWTQQILSRVAQRLGRDDRESVGRRIVADELQTLLSFDTGVDSESRRNVVALVGPPGAGKTTMLVKLAMRLGVSVRRSTLVLTTDNCRVAAADQLRTYAAVLGIPFQLIDSPAGLSSALTEHKQKELVLIDTPGFSPRDWDSARELAAMLEANPEVSVQLVLPATMRSSDLRVLVRRWSVFRPKQLIFTRIDETTSYGGCVVAALESNRPLSWLSTGQDIPEDVEPASSGRILGVLRMQKINAMAAVA